MRNTKFARTAAGVLALCVLMLTGCEKENENTVSETEASTTAETSESSATAAETAAAETVTAAETAPKEYEPVPKSTLNYDRVKDRVIFSDGENTLTAGQYIDALESCEEFDVSHPSFRSFQIMDMDGNGIPEIIVCGRFMAYTFSRLFTVSAEGKAEAVPILNHNLCDSSDHSECYILIGDKPSPYEKDGKTVWISNFSGAGCNGGFGGEYILQYDGSGIDGDVIDRTEYETYGQEDENGEWYWVRNDYYYIFGEEVTEKEFDRRKQEFFDSLQPSDALYVQSSMGSRENGEFTENIADALDKYLDMREGADKNYEELADKTVGGIPAQRYVDALIECEDIYKIMHALYGIQFADLNGDGMPELVLYDSFMTKSEYYAVSVDGTARYIHNKSQHDDWAWEFPYSCVKPYELNGETVWITENRSSGSSGGGYGNYFLRYDGNEIEIETIRECKYTNTDSNIEIYGEKLVYRYFWQGEEVSKEEYESRYEEFLGKMSALDEPNSYSTIIHGAGYEFKEALSLVLKDYIEYTDNAV